MTDYTKTTNFTAKDGLTTGDPNKLVKGSEIDSEFDNIETSNNTKANKIVGGTVSNVVEQDSNGDLVDTGLATPTGAFVGTSDNQTLTNKTLTTPRIDAVKAGGTNTQTFPTATTTIVGRDTTDTLTNKTIDGSQLVADSVSQSELDASAVGQSELKTATAVQSVNVVSDGGSSQIVLTGGLYSFWTASAADSGTAGSGVTFGHGNTAAGTLGFFNNDPASSLTVTVDSRYVQASPPYDLGDGEIQLFIQMRLNSLGNVIGYSVAPDPIWAYNGPTDIIPTSYGKDGRQWQKKLILPHDPRVAMANPALLLANKIAKEDSDNYQTIEITQAIKNADKEIVPHCWGTLGAGETVAMLDPVSSLVEGLRDLHDQGENIGKLIEDGYITFNNTSLVRGMPSQVMSVTPTWRKSGRLT